MNDYSIEDGDADAQQKLLAKKQQLENMIEDYFVEQDNNQIQKKKTQKLKKKNKKKDEKIDQIRVAKFEQEIRNKEFSKVKK